MYRAVLGYLFEKEYVDYGYSKIEVFKLLDYVLADKEDVDYITVLTGDYNNYNCAAISHEGYEGKYVFVEDELNIPSNYLYYDDDEITIDLNNMRNDKLSNTSKYYLRSEKNTLGVIKLTDEDLIMQLDNRDSEFKRKRIK